MNNYTVYKVIGSDVPISPVTASSITENFRIGSISDLLAATRQDFPANASTPSHTAQYEKGNNIDFHPFKLQTTYSTSILAASVGNWGTDTISSTFATAVVQLKMSIPAYQITQSLMAENELYHHVLTPNAPPTGKHVSRLMECHFCVANGTRKVYNKQHCIFCRKYLCDSHASAQCIKFPNRLKRSKLLIQ